MHRLIELTAYLMDELHHLKDIFYSEEKSLDKNAYFQHVKNKTTPIFDALNEWETLALDYVKSSKGMVTFQQIVATKENLEMIILHSYYKDIRKRRYMEYYSSCLYVLKQLKGETQS